MQQLRPEAADDRSVDPREQEQTIDLKDEYQLMSIE